MSSSGTDPSQDFRAAVRRTIHDDCPASMRQPLLSDDDACWGGRNWTFAGEDQKRWLERAIARGWTAPGWPTRYGGGGMTAIQQEILREEIAHAGCRPPLSGWGLTLLGPTLLHYGTEEQKHDHLRAIAEGRIRWCQGFSEPNAGSDLAALETTAELRDDVFVVNGQKLWTTYGDRADWMFCIVRTDPPAPKHLGISFLLIDMMSPGIIVRPVPLISGTSEFCEVFFDDVAVPRGNLVGTLNRGWDVAKFLLGCEREVSGRLKAQGARSIGQTLAAGMPLDPVARADIAEIDIEAWGLSCLIEDMALQAEVGCERPGFGSVIKYVGSELNKVRQEALMSQGGTSALLWRGTRKNDGALPRAWLRAKANSIAGGSNEMQFNMLAKRVLGLPAGQSIRATSGETVDYQADHRQIRSTISTILADAHPEAGVRAVSDTPGRVSMALWRTFADAGLCGLAIPVEFGGSGLGHAETSLVMQQLGRTRIPSPFLSRSIVAATLVQRAGTDAQRSIMGPRLADGTLALALALDEGPKHGSPIRTTASRRRGRLLLNGSKTFIVDGAICDRFVVVAQADDGSSRLVLVDRDAPGVTRTTPHLVDDQGWADIALADVAIDDADLLGSDRDMSVALDFALDAARIAVSGELLGLGDEACDQTIAYLKMRRQFDHQLAEYQALQHRIALVHIRLDLARSAVRTATSAIDRDADTRAAAAAAAKRLAIDAAELAVREAVQMHGGIGMTDAYDLGLFMKRIRVLAELYGDKRFQDARFATASGY